MADESQTEAELTFETPDGSETVTVPETFEQDDVTDGQRCSALPVAPERVYHYDDHLRAEAYLGDEKYFCAMWFAEDQTTVYNRDITGWSVEVVEADAPDEAMEIGETLWTAPDSDNF